MSGAIETEPSTNGRLRDRLIEIVNPAHLESVSTTEPLLEVEMRVKLKS